MSRFLGMIFVVLVAAGVSVAQLKSFETAQSEISGFADAGVFSLSYDESKYLTSVEINFEILSEEDVLREKLKKFDWQMTSFFTFKGIDTKPVRNVLCINSQSKSRQWLFLRENALTIFFPGEEIDLGEPNRSSEIKRGKASENMCWDISPEIITDLARAEKIEFRLGTIRTRIPADRLRIFRDYAKLLTVEPAVGD